MALTNARAHTANGTFAKAELNIGYQPAAAFGPIKLTITAHGSVKRFPIYSLGFANVTNGRQDIGAGMSVGFGIQTLDIMGFKPSVTLSNNVTTSNISRFDSRETTVRLSLRSSF